MTPIKKIALGFLSVINLINIGAGILVVVKLFTGSGIDSVIPIAVSMSVNQILLVNFDFIILIMALISIVVTYLVTDIPYSPKEILSNCPALLMIVPVIISLLGIYCILTATDAGDKLWIILSMIFYSVTSLINFGCIITVRDDAE